MARAEVSPITADDVDEVARFFHVELNPRVPVAAWRGLLQPPWAADEVERGVQLHVDGTRVGAYAAVVAPRRIAGSDLEVWNLAAFCVREEHRMHSIRLIRAILAHTGVVYTDLSPSGNVVAMNERLGFRHLDTATRCVLNTPIAPRRGIRVTTEPARLDAVLQGADRTVYRDHRAAAAARHVLVERDGAYAYLVYRIVSRRRLRLFAAPLYVGGDRELLEAAWGPVRAHLSRRGLPFTFAEERVLGFARGLGVSLARPRPKMVRGAVDDAAVDYLYSEMALLDW